MKIQKSFYGLLLIGVVAFSSCNKEEDPVAVDCTTWATEWAALGLDVVNKAAAYSADESTANCNAYLTSLDNLLNGMADLIDCVPTEQKSQIQTAIDGYQSTRNLLTCS